MNPLFRQPQIEPQNLQTIKSSMNMLRMAQRPSEALQLMAQNNPQMANVLQMCQGKNPKDVFYSECQRLGINPDDILKSLR